MMSRSYRCCLVFMLALACVSTAGAARAESPARPRLQIWNGSRETIDVYWLRSDTDRVPNGSAKAGRRS